MVIELLEGKPPYHFLDPMPALFRIVQDDSPPIPEGASPIVKDFLYHCFQKDCNLRISAKKLLRHPWMVAARKQMANSSNSRGEGGDKASTNGQRTNGNGAGASERRPLSNYNYDEAGNMAAYFLLTFLLIVLVPFSITQSASSAPFLRFLPSLLSQSLRSF